MTPDVRFRSAAATRRRTLLLVFGPLLLLLALLGGWVALQAGRGAADLRAAAEELRALEGLASADRLADRLEEPAARASSARRHFEDPLVRVVADVPWLGRPLRTASAIAVGADATVRQALLPLTRAAGADPAARLVASGGVVDIAFLTELNGPAAEALSALDAARDTVDAAPADGWSGRVDDARREVLEQLVRVRRAVDGLLAATEVGPELLGIGGPKRYLLVPQNPAEARGTGGLVGGWVTLEADAGILRMTGTGPSTTLRQFDSGEPVIDHGDEFTRNYGHNQPTAAWVNSNLSPHFPYAASTWAALWERQTRQRVDGVLALDPVALSHLLRATGSVRLADGTTVTHDKVVNLTLQDTYRRFGEIADRGARKQYLQEVSRAIAQELVAGEFDSALLLDGLGRSVRERRVLLWARDKAIADALDSRSISGRLPAGRPAVGDVIVNANGSKLDFYLDRSLTYSPGCASGSSSVALELRNGAPATGLPNYVTNPQYRGDDPAGTNKSTVTIYLPPQSAVGRVTADGRELPTFLQGEELGLRWVQTTVTLPPQARTVLRVDFRQEIGVAQDVERIRQPLVREERFTAISCG